MRLIGINGLKGAGKDSTALALRDALPSLQVQRVAFADNLKLLAGVALGFDRHDPDLLALMDSFKQDATIKADYSEPARVTEGWTPPEFRRGVSHVHELSGRQYLQYLGAGARRVFGEDFWVDQVLPASYEEFARKYREANVVVVTDVRYANEAVRIRALGGEVWAVQRPGLTSDGHSSEQPLPDSMVDRVIDNSGTLTDLARATDLAFFLGSEEAQ